MTRDVADAAAQWELETRLVRGGLDRSANGETSEALFLNSGFVYETAADAEARFKGEQDGFVYSRYGNPTVAMFEERMRLMEGAEACFATGSGMSAVFAALMSQLKTGDRVVASRALFGSCHHILTQILPRFGIESVLVEGTDLDAWADALKPGAAVVFLETPANPTLDLIDLRAVSDLAHAAGARVVVDNVFATPVLQRPMDHGVDIVVYSATKHIDGQGRVLGGAVLGSRDFVDNSLMPFLRHTGPALSPFNAWVLLKGLETLTLRVERMCGNAAKVAAHLSAQPGVSRVIWPGADDFPQRELRERQMTAGGTLITLEIAGGKQGAFRFMDRLRIIDISNNLGDSKSLVTHPTTTTHRAISAEDRARIGISEGMLRLSVGLENPEDLKADISQALAGGD
ncbi:MULTISPECIES: O-succinylhomoserine sulfhydrylase [unclassified Minwuia]|uniref:O-succinylhomoserine sulfhydrylase n=1 Tax=unclassified Minwuia TaxID=2618799 RepID=UPI0024792FD1|nr:MULTISPECIES: O-succinylhomoserine sulfhydrylase [unclassified Minwuia]